MNMNEPHQRGYRGEGHFYNVEKLTATQSFWRRYQWQMIAFVALGLVVVLTFTTFMLAIKLLSVPTATATPTLTPKTDGRWQGQFTYYPGEPYSTPFQAMLQITPHQGNAFVGTLSEPALGNTMVSVSGTAEGSSQLNQSQLQYVTQLYGNGTGMFMAFTDTAYIQGNQVQLNCSYIAVVYSDGSLHGVWFYPGSTRPDGTFILNK